MADSIKLYHRIPANLIGDTLYPLNQLKEKYPRVYASAIKKYQGREHLLEDTIPILNCLWNDVLHTGPVHPRKAKEAFEELGKDFLAKRYFEIDSSILDPDQTVTYWYKYLDKKDKYKTGNFERFDAEKLRAHTDLPPWTKGYYREQFENDKNPLLWVRVPHILYLGTLKTRDLRVIEV